MDEIFDLDLEFLSSISDGDEAFEVELVEEYVADAGKLVSHLQEAAEVASVPDLLSIAHTLKGSSRSVGAEHVAAACERLEMTCRAGETGEFSVMVSEVKFRLDRLAANYLVALRRAA